MLLDVTLPGVSSREVVEQARVTRPNLKVILTSAYGRETVDTSLPDCKSITSSGSHFKLPIS